MAGVASRLNLMAGYELVLGIGSLVSIESALSLESAATPASAARRSASDPRGNGGGNRDTRSDSLSMLLLDCLVMVRARWKPFAIGIVIP